MNRSLAIAGAFVQALTVTGCSVLPSPSHPTLTSDTVNTAPTLAQGYLQPVNPTWWRAVQQLPLQHADGQAVTLPTDRPVFFFAWWSESCRAGLTQLQRDGQLSHMTLVSLYLNAAPPHGAPVPVRTVEDAQRVTQASLDTLGIHLPADHIVYLMPNGKESVVIGVPTLIERTMRGWYVMNGAPARGDVWQEVMHEVAIPEGGHVHG